MVETNTSKDITVLEKTVQRLARELGVVLQDTSGISYIRFLEGKKDNLELDYHNTFDNYECLAIERGDSRIHICNIEGEHNWGLKNTYKKLIESAFQKTTNPVEKKMDLWILLSKLENKIVPEKNYNTPLIVLKKSELDLITAKTILKYLS